MNLCSLTPEGRILLVLNHGKHTYKEIKFETGLSDRWLSIKLEELIDKGIVKKDGRWYSSVRLEVSSYELSLFMLFQARRIAGELAKLSYVKMIILFGGVAQKRVDEFSDLDMIIVVDNGLSERAKMEIRPKISRLEMKYHIMIEPLILEEDDFLDNVHSNEGGIVYGVAAGFDVLFDKTRRLSVALHDRVEEIKRSHEYLSEAGIWLRAR